MAVEQRLIDIGNGARNADAGIVDQHVEIGMVPHNRFAKRLDAVARRKIAGELFGWPLQLRRHRIEKSRLAVDKDEAPAARIERAGKGRADAAARSGDQRLHAAARAPETRKASKQPSSSAGQPKRLRMRVICFR